MRPSLVDIEFWTSKRGNLMLGKLMVEKFTFGTLKRKMHLFMNATRCTVGNFSRPSLFIETIDRKSSNSLKTRESGDRLCLCIHWKLTKVSYHNHVPSIVYRHLIQSVINTLCFRQEVKY